MAFRASNVIPSMEYTRVKQLAVQLKRLAQNRSASFAGGADANEILALVDNLNGFKTGLDAAKAIPGIGTYASDQENDPAYNVGAQFNTMLAAVDAIITEVVSTLPTDDSGWMLIRSIAAGGTLTPRTFTGSQLSQIRTLLDALDQSIS